MSANQSSINDLLNGAFSGLVVKNEDNTEAIAALLDKFGLRWTVSKETMHRPNGDATGFYGIVRDDTGKTFSTCKEEYTPFQNSEMAELLVRIAEKGGYEIHSGGSFNGGGKIYLQLKTNNKIQNLGNNRTTVEGFATAINSHDGTTSLKWGAANFTICCGNTFALAAKTLQESARHTKSLHDRVEESLRRIHGIAEIEKSLFDTFIKLSEISTNHKQIAAIVRDVTEVDITLTKAQAEKEYSTYALNRTQELLGSISKEMQTKGNTLWGLFSGVTHYTSHVLSTPKRDNARLESKYTGTALQIDNSAYKMVMDFATN